jgi:starvation-inducible DNA-binding protein
MACSFKSCGCVSVDVLSKLLANSYVLLIKTQNVHWNVTSANFMTIHLMTEGHYENLFKAVDVIAERIRMVGGKTPAAFAKFKELASFSDETSANCESEMLKELLSCHTIVCSDLKLGIAELSGSSDFATLDILNNRLVFHEKIVWMLKATVEE